MKNILTIVLLYLSISAFAQVKQPLSIDLNQAIELGLKNRFDLKAEDYNLQRAENQVQKAKKAWVPDLHAEGQIQYSMQLQPTYVPGGFFGFTEPQMLHFGAKNVTAFGLTLNQPLFRPGIQTDLKMARANFDLEQEKINGQEIEIKAGITTAYLNVLLKQLQLNIAQNEENRFEKYESLAQGKFKNGALIKNDYLRAQLDYENAKVNTTTQKQDYELALQFLKYQMNEPDTVPLFLSDSIETISLVTTPDSLGNGGTTRTEIKQLKLQQKLNEIQLKRVKENAIPTLSIYGYYAQLFQNDNFHYDDTKWWAPHSYVGVQMTIPISSNLINQNNIKEEKLKHQQLDLQLQQTESDVQYQIEKATADRQNALMNMQTAKKNYELAQTIYANQQQQFSIGVFRYSDLLDTEKSLSRTEQNYIVSVYQYLMASLEYKKAKGEL